ncbi:EamA family transporter [Porticoccus sp. W117]|uniref:DMT family transporter n=1 Tax=Porticoccus sp. W117 TaxID=3054777 RepID=UPI0025972A86|nr:EamA family transporter [Porticoccus sp. W117]MDM3872225.1 EamA family transporter [Porticoccus sp. W117]
MNNLFLYIAVVLIWGSTFFGITFQLGVVDPLISLVYRFALAVLLLLAWCRYKNLSLRIERHHHPYLFYQGSCLFAINYWFVYLAEEHITSGIVAVMFTTIIFLNIINGRLLLKRPFELRVLIGAIVGFLGVALIYYPEIEQSQWSRSAIIGLLFGIGAPVVASLGNIAAARNGQQGLPVVQTNTWSMAYGTVLMLLAALVMGKPFTMEWTFPYLASMGFLVVFGTVIAFCCYLLLIQRIGPERAAYSALLIPLVALGLSTLFEGYQWTATAFLGVVMILGGNYFALKKT